MLLKFINLEQRKSINEFRRIITYHGLKDLLAIYGSDRSREAAIRFDIKLLPSKLQLLLKLFVLHEFVDVKYLTEILPTNQINILIELKVLEQLNNKVRTQNLRLIFHYGILLFCEFPSVHSKMYYGLDSQALGKLLLSARGKVLDLCAGVGTQGLLCALNADSVISVEKECSLEHIFEVNVVLNELDSKIEFRLGDLTDTVRGEFFDLICCNPPLLPIPDKFSFPQYANGGIDGLNFTRRILADLPSIMKRDGHCYIIGTVLGSEDRPDLEVIKKLSELNNLKIFMIFPHREVLSVGEPLFEALVYTAYIYSKVSPSLIRNAILNLKKRKQDTYIYSFYLCARFANKANDSNLIETTGHYLRGSNFWNI